MSVSSLGRALRDGRPQIGLSTRLASPLAAEVLALAGFDSLVIDTHCK
jgi:2-keto-3-deoxy-L-rhamnonate aldolase RhmA